VVMDLERLMYSRRRSRAEQYQKVCHHGMDKAGGSRKRRKSCSQEVATAGAHSHARTARNDESDESAQHQPQPQTQTNRFSLLATRATFPACDRHRIIHHPSSIIHRYAHHHSQYSQYMPCTIFMSFSLCRFMYLM
jgi:hypothetical protein